MRILAFSAVGALTLFSAFSAAADGSGISEDFVIAGPQRAATVVPCGRRSATGDYAVSELVSYVRRMTGVELPVCTNAVSGPAVWIEDDGRTEADAFDLTVGADGLHVRGGKRGVLYGVYELLERYGDVGWYSSWHEVVPVRTVFAVPRTLAVHEKPAFALREPMWFDTRDGAFAARLRLTGNYQQMEAKHGGHDYAFSKRLRNCHSFATLVPTEKYFRDHPEYFSLVGGKRLEKNTQLCLTNPDVFQIVLREVLRQIELEPEAKYFGISQNDCPRNYCECPACAAIDAEEGTHAGAQIRFVNAIAAEVAKRHPDKVIETLAYQYTRKPPKKTRLLPNVMPCLCTIECDFAQPLTAEACPQNKAFLEDLRQWASMTDQLYVWDYTANYKHYLLVHPNVRVLQPNIRLFRENGVVSLFEQGVHQGLHGDFAELKAWLLAKWMWNPDLPAEPLQDRFFAGYYGPAAACVRACYERLHDAQAAASAGGDRPLGIGTDAFEIGVDDELLDWCCRQWRQAEKAVAQADPVYGYNVRMGALSAVYTKFMRQQRKIWVTDRPERFNGGKSCAKVASWILARLKEAKKPVRLAEHGGELLLKRIEEEAAHGVAPVRARHAEVPVGADLAPNSFAATAKDPTVSGGTVIEMRNREKQWSILFPIGVVGFDREARYRISIHAKVEVPSGTSGAVAAFHAGLYDFATHKGVACRGWKVSETKGGWAWYSLEPAELVESQKLYIAPDDLPCVSVDRIAIDRCSQEEKTCVK